MSLYVYITDECLNDAKSHAFVPKLIEFKERLEREQRENLFDPFPPPYKRKRFIRQLRLVVESHNIGDDVVVCFLRLMVRGNSDYTQGFLKDTNNFRQRCLSSLVTEKQLEKFILERARKEPIKPKIRPTNEEQRYLWEVFLRGADSHSDDFVCESEDWIKIASDRAISRKMVLFNQLIQDALSNGTGNGRELYLMGKKEIGILYRYFPSLKKLFLVAPLCGNNCTTSQSLQEKYQRILSSPADIITENELLQYTARTYPAFITLDDDMWLKLEEDAAANMALSPEETMILESVERMEEDYESRGFPLFINGRAGSGKSTILQYLFASYLFFHLNEKPGIMNPLYFTCSTELLRHSRGIVKKLIQCNHKWLLEGNELDETALTRILESFQEFHSFLYHRLTPGDLNRFPQGKYVNYARFKKLWNSKFGHIRNARRDFGPDHSWHVVRSYIKGLSPDDYIDLEEYEQIPRRQRTISFEMFDRIYEKVWKNWYQKLCENKNYWDDQDLARVILNGDLLKPRHPAIFCDEAQDFTRIELELIFRLSIFSERSLLPKELNRVPFAFAGDHFQTLNPTGFRWDAMKVSYIEKFINSLDPEKRSGLDDLNYRELSFNYRSTMNIVKLCNSIQAFRAILFELKDVKPQSNWQAEQNSPMPVWYERSNTEVLTQLRKEQDITIILPCEEGEEIEYVNNDEILSQLIRQDEIGVPQNVLSTSRAKGLEFNRVILYGFGEACPNNLKKLIEDIDTIDHGSDETLPLEYFMNRLYVAASRPKRRLFIIDSKEGMEKLWFFTKEKSIYDLILENLRDGKKWKDHIGGIQPGVSASLTGDREDQEDVAEKLEKEGKNRKDPYYYRSAALSYENIGNSIKAIECRANALLIEQKYTEAGALFMEIEQYISALKAFWIGYDTSSILQIVKKDHGFYSRLECKFASYVKGERDKSIEEGTTLLNEFLYDWEKGNLDGLFSQVDESWKKAIKELFGEIVKLYEESATKANWDLVAKLSDKLSKIGFTIDQIDLAYIKYFAGDMERAYSIWDKLGKKNLKEYKHAKSYVIEYPENLSILNELGDKDRIIGYYENSPKTILLDRDGKIVANAYSELGHYSEALSALLPLKDVTGLRGLIKASLSGGDKETAFEATKNFLEVMVNNNMWRDCINLVCGKKNDQFQRKDDLLVLEFIKVHSISFKASLVKTMARSSMLPEQGNQVQKHVSDYLRGIFMKKDLSWKQMISVQEAGSAIERAGRIVDSLEFYESIEKNRKFSKVDRQFAEVRWVKCKEKQVRREAQRRMYKIAEKHDKEAEERRRELGIEDLDSIPEFPESSKITGSVLNYTKEAVEEVGSSIGLDKKEVKAAVAKDPSKLKPFECEFGNFRLSYYKKNEKLIIMNHETAEIATVQVENDKFTGDVKFTKNKKKKREWVCSSWDLAYSAKLTGKTRYIEVRLLYNNARFQLPLSTK